MKRLWWSVLTLEIVLIIAFYVRGLASPYFLGAPWVQSGRVSIEALVGERAQWLAGILGLIDVSIFTWIKGVKLVASPDRLLGIVSLVTSVASFIGACVALFVFVVFGFAQY